MDILKFINSRDIREHLKSIDYQFSALEAAWIIWKSKYTSLNEKYDAWTEIIQTMPDCEIEGRPNTIPHPSLHGLLKELMDFERCIETSQDGEIIKIYNPDAMTQEEINLYKFGFDGMWFDFPNPFKRGDIIYNPSGLSRTDFECDYGPCVLEEPIPLRDGVERWKKPSGGDSSDMVVHGLFQREDGTVFSECTANYMNFEYYRGKLDGKKRILMAISNYLKDEISLELLLNAYHVILAEEYAKDTRPYNITKEALELAGIPERKNDE